MSSVSRSLQRSSNAFAAPSVPRRPASTRALLRRILEQPDLPAQIERLPPRVLGKLIDRVGLEDAGELVALASTEQIAQVFDEDLWKNERPGEEERFDPERFLLWLEVMLEAGEELVAKRLAELPEDLVTLALHRHVLVIDIDALATEMAEEDEEDWQLEKALESTLHEELGEYRLIARRHDGWDTLITAVVALDKEHHDHLFRILERCCAMSAQYIEENDGLYAVLTSEETLEADVAGDREDRRAEAGHVAPTAAKSFLALALTEPDAAKEARDPVTKAYFRELSRAPVAKVARPREDGRFDALPRILAEAGVVEEAADPRLLTGKGGGADPLFLQAMRAVADSDPALYAERAEELAYLANVLVSGGVHEGRRFRPIEALRAAIATCSLGLAMTAKRATLEAAIETLRSTPADVLFRKAYRDLDKAPTPPSAKAPGAPPTAPRRAPAPSAPRRSTPGSSAAPSARSASRTRTRRR